jgi:hypothetical protein
MNQTTSSGHELFHPSFDPLHVLLKKLRGALHV